MRNSKILYRFFVSFLAIILLVGCFSALTSCNSDNRPNSQTRQQLRDTAQNAQYLPNADMLVPSNIIVFTPKLSSQEAVPIDEEDYFDLFISMIDFDFTLEGYNKLIEEIGWLDSPYDRNFTIIDIRDEVCLILDEIDVYNRWVQVNSEPLRGQGTYYINYDDKADRFSIMRVSSFQPYVYLHDQKTVKWNGDYEGQGYALNQPFQSYEIYKIDYYSDADGREVVECTITSMLSYFGEIIPIGYQYVKNVKDHSFTKYNVLKEPIRFQRSDSTGIDAAIDVDTREFTYTEFFQLDYDDKDNIQMLFSNQRKTSSYNGEKAYTTIRYYDKHGGATSFYNTTYCYGGQENGLREEMLFNHLSRINYDIMEYYLSAWGSNWNSVRSYGSDYSPTNLPDKNSDYAAYSTSNITAIEKELGQKKTGEKSFYVLPSGSVVEKNKNEVGSILVGMVGTIQSLSSALNAEDVLDASLAGKIDCDNWRGNNSFEDGVNTAITAFASHVAQNDYIKNNFTEIQQGYIQPKIISGKSLEG